MNQSLWPVWKTRKAGPRLAVPSKMGGWWRGLLARSLDTAQLDGLAAGVTATREGRTLSPEEDQRCEMIWGLLWDKAKGADLDKLRLIFGSQGDWRQLLTGR